MNITFFPSCQIEARYALRWSPSLSEQTGQNLILTCPVVVPVVSYPSMLTGTQISLHAFPNWPTRFIMSLRKVAGVLTRRYLEVAAVRGEDCHNKVTSSTHNAWQRQPAAIREGDSYRWWPVMSIIIVTLAVLLVLICVLRGVMVQDGGMW
jgi:hypothetical protein